LPAGSPGAQGSAASTGEPPTAPEIPPATVEIRSTPTGVNVLVEGALVGQTPLDLPLPLDIATEYELRHAGYRRMMVEVGPDTVGPIDVELVAIRESGRRGRSRTTSSSSATSSSQTSAGSSSRMTYSRQLTDVVDPWDN
jgi:hypothetical protein